MLWLLLSRTKESNAYIRMILVGYVKRNIIFTHTIEITKIYVILKSSRFSDIAQSIMVVGAWGSAASLRVSGSFPGGVAGDFFRSH
jgi:hypothetical protein